VGIAKGRGELKYATSLSIKKMIYEGGERHREGGTIEKEGKHARDTSRVVFHLKGLRKKEADTHRLAANGRPVGHKVKASRCQIRTRREQWPAKLRAGREWRGIWGGKPSSGRIRQTRMKEGKKGGGRGDPQGENLELQILGQS